MNTLFPQNGRKAVTIYLMRSGTEVKHGFNSQQHSLVADSERTTSVACPAAKSEW